MKKNLILTDLVKRSDEDYWVAFVVTSQGDVRDFHFEDSKDVLNWIRYVRVDKFLRSTWSELYSIINLNK